MNDPPTLVLSRHVPPMSRLWINTAFASSQNICCCAHLASRAPNAGGKCPMLLLEMSRFVRRVSSPRWSGRRRSRQLCARLKVLSCFRAPISSGISVQLLERKFTSCNLMDWIGQGRLCPVKWRTAGAG